MHLPHLTPLVDVDPQALPPVWPPRPEWLIVDEPQYELATVPLSSIVMATYESIKAGVLLTSALGLR